MFPVLEYCYFLFFPIFLFIFNYLFSTIKFFSFLFHFLSEITLFISENIVWFSQKSISCVCFIDWCFIVMFHCRSSEGEIDLDKC